TAGAQSGQIVVAEILDYPSYLEQPTGRIIRIIGSPDQKGIATDIAIHAHGIPDDWPQAVRQQADKFGEHVPTGAKKGRVDLRDLDLVTIDGADARDFDDAVYCEPTRSGWRLLVAIADVSHYVDIRSAIDKEAVRRGTSVYFPDRVVPMLPEILSNGLCSLNPKVDRLCMVCEMRVDREGKVTRSRFFEGVMRSSARLTYGQVGGFLEGERQKGIAPEFHERLSALHELYRAFQKRRSRRGAIELDIPQSRIEVDRDGAVASIAAVRRNDAHRLIEECMIAANVQAAKFLRRHRIPGLYRVHAKPDAESFGELRDYLVGLGLKVPHPDHVKPKDFSRLVRQIEGRVDSAAISMTMLRALPHAEYTPDNIGHFGLALDAYAHFTSPIRRYPDLLVHRAIKHILNGGKPGNYYYKADRMERLGVLCSAHERRAEDATREVEALLKCQYMEDRIGERYEGVITGVTNFGIFVQLDDIMVDGLVHVSSLDNDYYHFEPAAMTLVGERTGARFAIGDPMSIVVQRVDLDTRRIDFRPAENRPSGSQRGRRRR
ncbi:MAG: ribonuclease R, partial [Woeseiaceae bacterium]|nr:ribonuclease R [Woeseiaceae bacterium]